MSEQLPPGSLTGEGYERLRQINYCLAKDKRSVGPADAAWFCETLERHGRRIPAKRLHGSPLGFAYEIRLLGEPSGLVIESYTFRLARRMRGKFSETRQQQHDESKQSEPPKEPLPRMHDHKLLEKIALENLRKHGDCKELKSFVRADYTKETRLPIHASDKNLQRILKKVRNNSSAQISSPTVTK